MEESIWERVDSRFEKIWALRCQWHELLNAPTTQLGTQSWIGKVLLVWHEARKLKAPFVDPKSPLREFNGSVDRMLGTYNTHSRGTRYLKEQGDLTLEVIEHAQSQHLQVEYRRACLDVESDTSELTAPQNPVCPSNILCVTASSQSVEASGTRATPVTQPATDVWPADDHDRGCICGIIHSGGIPGCFYCIPELRPRNFVIKERVEQRIQQKVASNPKLQLYINKARAKYRNGSRIPPPRKTFTTEVSRMCTPKEVSSASGDSQIIANAEGSSAVVSVGPGLSIRPAVKATQESDSPHPMSKSWILSITSSVCVCNNRESFVEFEPTPPGKTIFAHGQKLTVAGSGKAEVQVETPEGNPQIVTFPDVWYIPDYYTNIISLDALEEAGVFWDHRNDILIMNDEPWCNVTRVHGMRVLQYIPVKGLDIL